MEESTRIAFLKAVVDEVIQWHGVLAGNLMIGAALCRAWRLGYLFDTGAVKSTMWRPGCGVNAP